MHKKTVTVLIPCHNEEQGIAKVLDRIPSHLLRRAGFETEVLVVDNNSSDRTSSVAKSREAQVVFEPVKGKGNAVRKAFSCLGTEPGYVVMLDGDNTYDAGEMLRLLEPLMAGFCDVVVGSRLNGKITKHALKTQNRLVNTAYTSLVRGFYGTPITDVLSGYFAWRKDVVLALREHLCADDFRIEMEMITKLAKLHYSMYSVPISYSRREGETKIVPVKDGLKILSTFSRNLFWSPSYKEVAILQEREHKEPLFI
ncbi:mannosyltransferase [Reticulibacter mediterranei]|uniref:Mannosyltransferase n=1 Tax=Reticulibacter mediterranei TaxID=2778369 RepID=A0A8J3IXA4_9CHLR|nr:glycosyltransferase family 2 protein [Reticulibacter mediterranei]GHO98520.1 mannosyltransferase [Reticulibacter mediterranei]